MTPSENVVATGPTLAEYGYDERWQAFLAVTALNENEPLMPARVTAVHRGALDVATVDIDGVAEISTLGTVAELRSRTRTLDLGLPGHSDDDASWPPVVGDWLALDGEHTIRAILSRRSYLARPSAGRDSAEQPVAANIDVLVIVEPLVPEASIGRAERFVALAHAAGVSAWVVLTKADLVDAQHGARSVEKFGHVADVVHLVSTVSGQGINDFARDLATVGTAVFLGRSGAGKSTLTNVVLGTERVTGVVRAGDAKGRHTTTSRGLVAGRGCVVIDTPGIRALAATTDAQAIDDTFADIVSLATDCRFRDCQHDSEPECAVRQAVAAGDVEAARVQRYRRMRAESERLRQRTDARLSRAQERRASREDKSGRRGTMRLKGRAN